MLTLRLLGGASIEGEAGPLTGPVAQRHRLALLALLARAHPGGIGRDKLVAYLWPERDTEHARNLLRQALHALRKALGEDAIRSAGDELWLDPGAVRVDVIEFDEALEAGEPERALELHRGPFLDGFFLPGAVEFERWAEAKRALIRAAYRNALEALAEAAAASGDSVRAVEWWRRLAADDPCSTRVALELMQALESAGERAEAIRHARVHALLLDQELGAEPAPAVVALAERMRADAPDELEVEHRAPPSIERTSSSEFEARTRGRPGQADGRRRRPMKAAALIIGAVAVLVSGSYLWSRNGGPDASADPRSEAIPVEHLAPGEREVPSIAVLAFDDLSPEGDQEWFADGIAEEVVHALTGVQGLRVSALSSSFAFRGRPVDVRGIAHTLGVDLILEGSVRRGGDSVWVTAHLVDGPTGLYRWSETYAKAPTAANLRSIQDQIARDMAGALALRFRGEPDAGSAVPGDELYEVYLEGRYHLRRFQSGATRDSAEVLRSVDYFRQVVADQPGWAPGWAALGEAYSWGAFIGFEPAKHHAASKRALERALALDPGHAQANATLAYLLHRWDRDYEAADARFRRALGLDSEQYWHCGYSLFLLWAGRYDEAVDATRRSEAHNPLYVHLKTLLSSSYRCAGRFEEAIAYANDILALEPRAGVAWRDLALALERAGRGDEALARLDEWEAAETEWTGAAGQREYRKLLKVLLLARMGRPTDAERLLARVDTDAAAAWAAHWYSSRQIGPPAVHAAALVALGRPEEAIEILQAAMVRNPEVLLYDRCYPELAELEGDPRYRELLRQTGVPGW